MLLTTPANWPACPSVSDARRTCTPIFWLLEALILAFLLRMSPRFRRVLARGGVIPPTVLAALSPDAPAHALCIALGLVPDWILRGTRARGMRATPALRPRPRRIARAPPAHDSPAHPRETPSLGRSRPHALNRFDYTISSRSSHRSTTNPARSSTRRDAPLCGCTNPRTAGSPSRLGSPSDAGASSRAPSTSWRRSRTRRFPEP